MKVFLAQCVDAAASLDLAALKRPIVFLFTADEEVGCLGAARLMPALSDLLDDIPRPRLAWIGEPTSYQVFHAHKGVAVFSITIHGLGGHSSTPEHGVNAIAVAGKVIDTIGQYQAELYATPSTTFAELFPESPYPTLNFGLLRGGTAGNMIAEQCTIQISYRPLPKADPLVCYHEIARRVRALDLVDYSGSSHRASLELTEPLIVPPLFSPRGTPLEGALFEVLDQHTSGGAPFATDGCQFASGGIASLICGPGDLDQAHQPNESIRRETFENGTERILAVVRRLCETPAVVG
jgi:acetylornithine deacetylase